MNAITLTGNLVDKPIKVEYGEGKALVNFRMGNNELDHQGENRQNGFFDVTVFGPQAEYVFKSLTKGERIIVTGRLEHSTFTRDDGSKDGRTKIIASEVAMSLAFDRAKRKKSEKSEGPF